MKLHKRILFMGSLALTLVTAAGCTTGSSNATSASTSSATTASLTKTSTKATTAKLTKLTKASEATYGSYKDSDFDATYSTSSATKITLNDSKSSVDGSGATASGQNVNITKGGTYILSGTLTNGQIKVKTSEDVQIVLNGVKITNSTGSAIYVEEAKNVKLTLAKSSSNTVSDGSKYAATGDDDPDAAIYSTADLTMNGTGSLTVDGNYKAAIHTKDDLVVTDGTYTLKAKSTALKGTDSVNIAGGAFEITSGGDGIQAAKADDAKKGYVAIDSGSFTIKSTTDAIQAETTLKIAQGNFKLTTGGGAAASTKASDASSADNMGRPGQQTTTTTSTDTASEKALKAGGDIEIAGGAYTIDAQDDSVHSSANVIIKGGEMVVKTGDDGIHADGTLSIEKGTVSINQAYEGLEAKVINVKGGTTKVVTTDDGVNASDGSSSSTGGGMGQAPGSTGTGTDGVELNISGGTLYVNAEGDGLDSNGSITMTGGVALVDGPTSAGNGALDYDSTFKMTGGTLVAAGSTGMVQTVSDSSTQAAASIAFDSSQKADTWVTVKDSDGKVLFSYKPAKAYQNIVVSSPDMKSGSSYSLSTGGTVSDSKDANFVAAGTVSGDTKVTTVALTAVNGAFNQAGEAQATPTGMGGGMRGGHGGTPPTGAPTGTGTDTTSTTTTSQAL